MAIIVNVEASEFSDAELLAALNARGYQIAPTGDPNEHLDALAILAGEGVPQEALRFIEELLACTIPTREAIAALVTWARSYGINL